MTLQADDKLMSLTDVSEMLGIPVHTLYRWRYNGDGPAGYRVWPSCPVSQRGRRRLARATSRQALLGVSLLLTTPGKPGDSGLTQPLTIASHGRHSPNCVCKGGPDRPYAALGQGRAPLTAGGRRLAQLD